MIHTNVQACAPSGTIWTDPLECVLPSGPDTTDVDAHEPLPRNRAGDERNLAHAFARQRGIRAEALREPLVHGPEVANRVPGLPGRHTELPLPDERCHQPILRR
jgi:hypothetical protein